MNKKMILSLGGMATILSPVMTVISCSPDDGGKPDNDDAGVVFENVDLTNTDSGKALKSAILGANTNFTEISELKIKNFKIDENKNFEYTIYAKGKNNTDDLTFTLDTKFDFLKNKIEIEIENPDNTKSNLSSTFHQLFSNNVDTSQLNNEQKNIYKGAYKLLEITMDFATKDVLKNIIDKEFSNEVTKAYSKEPAYEQIDLNSTNGQKLKAKITSNESDSVLFTELSELKFSNTKSAENNFQIATNAIGKLNGVDLNIEIIQNIDFQNEKFEIIIVVDNSELTLELSMSEIINQTFLDDLTDTEKKIAGQGMNLFDEVMDFANQDSVKNFVLNEFMFEIGKSIFAYQNNIDFQNADLINTNKGPLLVNTITNASGDNAFFAEVDYLSISNTRLEQERNFQYGLYIYGEDWENQPLSTGITFDFDFANNTVTFKTDMGLSSGENPITITALMDGTFIDNFDSDAKILINKIYSLVVIIINFWDEDVLQNLVLEDFESEIMTIINQSPAPTK